MPMSDRYNFSLTEYSVYENVVELVRRFAVGRGGVVVDIGCGYGAIAEAVTELGLDYVGMDLEVAGIEALEKRGYGTAEIDLSSPAAAVGSIDTLLAGRTPAALVMIDVLEHITNGPDVLEALGRFAIERGGVPLVLAVPNVTHFDLAAKLLLGRWDMTETGLLDDTHVSFFSNDRLRCMCADAGWVEIGANDFELPISDQHFPSDAAALQVGSPLHGLLFDVSDRSTESTIVNEFVRAFAPIRPSTGQQTDEDAGPPPLLSILMRTQGKRPTTLQEALLSLAAQTDQDFEVLLLAHDVQREALTHMRFLADAFGQEFGARVRLVPVDGGGRTRPLSVGVEQARGRYVAILDDDDVVFGHWVETYQAMATKFPGRVLRSPVAEQEVVETVWNGDRTGYEVVGRPRCRWPEAFDVLDHLWENHSPPCGWAVPRSIFRDHGLRFDETLPVLEDWDVLLQAVLWCGVADSGKITALWRRWKVGDSSTSVHTDIEWQQARMAVTAKLDARPLLLPARSMTAIQAERTRRDIYQREAERLQTVLDGTVNHVAILEQRLVAAHLELDSMRRSSSWKVSKPVRLVGDLARRAAGGQQDPPVANG
jgi:hypothetical protein